MGAIAAVLALSAGCAYRVTPPVKPAIPIAVYVIDYGHHSSLVLPRAGGELHEYAYGEWEWFAKNREDWWRAPLILLIPSRGALGTRPVPFDEATVRSITTGSIPAVATALVGPFESVHGFDADLKRVEALRSELDQWFNAGRDSEYFNQRQRMLFVPSDRSYSCFFHCNTATAEWLRKLGCDVDGGGGTAEFVIERK